MNKKVEKAGKYMSLLLRHKPELENLEMDDFGYVNSKELIKKLDISMNDLDEIVNTNNKKRFSYNKDKSKIRANQGHSKDVDVQLKEQKPPECLYHGTATRFLSSIYDNGINKGDRLHVHLSENLETAENVGSRHGSVFILHIDTEQMYNDGCKFYISENGVWLTDYVDTKYIKN